PATGTYFVVVGGVASEGDYSVTIGVANNEMDFYSFDLQAGDILGALLVDGADHVGLYGPDGTLLDGRFFEDAFLQPMSSPLPGGGFGSVSYGMLAPGRLVVAVSAGRAAFSLPLRAFRPALEQPRVFTHQVPLLDVYGVTAPPVYFPFRDERARDMA